MKPERRRVADEVRHNIVIAPRDRSGHRASHWSLMSTLRFLGQSAHREPPQCLRDDGAWRRLAAANMTRKAALLLFNLAHIGISAICRMGFAYAQARIETE
jgi:hypothetical protein